MSVQVVPVGNAPDGPVVVGAGVARPTLDQLTDVDGFATAADDTPLVLRKGDDGVVRPEPAAVSIGTAVEDALEDALQSGAVGDAVTAAVDTAVGEAAADILDRPRDYSHVQQAPAALWQITHHLGYLPTFTAYDTEGREVRHGGISHPVPGEVSEVVFGMPLAGTGYAS